jgi:hypothetical protein
MSISRHALSAATISLAVRAATAGAKVPPSRLTVATAERRLVPLAN